MGKKNKNSEQDPKQTKLGKDKEQEKAFEKWKEKDKNNMGNDVSSEIKIANAGGEMEGGDNKQWHMDQGDFNEDEKNFFENSDQKK
jgi:hypothetical protein